MGYKRLYKNLIDIIKEEQAKLVFHEVCFSSVLLYPVFQKNGLTNLVDSTDGYFLFEIPILPVLP